MDLGLKEMSSNTACFRAQTELNDAFSHILRSSCLLAMRSRQTSLQGLGELVTIMVADVTRNSFWNHTYPQSFQRCFFSTERKHWVVLKVYCLYVWNTKTLYPQIWLPHYHIKGIILFLWTSRRGSILCVFGKHDPSVYLLPSSAYFSKSKWNSDFYYTNCI